eukprot:TRINITY_DN9922_c0_g1_i1.p1 TRINITY_DN9922_c0_g1~~TRINITY_DN9922_c0_g1_i1.p1  ORF type:complete len:589 (+),score=98.10 TRINITY_DN9922_c0_g1_i1:44-1810(+)
MDIQTGATEVLSQRTSQASIEGVYDCESGSCYEVFTGIDMHVPYRIVVDADKEERSKVLTIIKTVFQMVDDELNNWNESSLISKYNNLPVGESIAVSPSLREVLLISDEVHKQTDGLFDPTKTGDWATPKLSKTATDGYLLTKERNVQLDLCGISKGYAVDIITLKLQQEGFTDCYVEWGGDAKTIGGWNVAIRDKDDGILGHVITADMAVATSGTGRSVHCSVSCDQSIKTVSCLHSQCAFADAFATSLMLDTKKSFCSDVLIYSLPSTSTSSSIKKTGMFESQFGKQLTKHPHCRDLLKSVPHQLLKIRLMDKERDPITVSSAVCVEGSNLVFFSLMKGSAFLKEVGVGCKVGIQQHSDHEVPVSLTGLVVDVCEIGDHSAIWCSTKYLTTNPTPHPVTVRQRSVTHQLDSVNEFFVDSMTLILCNNQFIKSSGIRLHSQSPYLISVVCRDSRVKVNDQVTAYVLDEAHYNHVNESDLSKVKTLKSDDGLVIPLEHGHVKGVVTKVHRSVVFIEVTSSCSLSRCSNSVLFHTADGVKLDIPTPSYLHPLWLFFKIIIIWSLAFAILSWWVVQPYMIEYYHKSHTHL